MEKRLNKKIEGYVTTFKGSLCDKVNKLGFKSDEINELIQYIYEYERLILDKDDFMKRKRVKNIVPYFDRCCAKRANGEQCTRKKKDECCYCGTHTKGTPHGVVNSQEDQTNNQTQKIEVWAQDIQGIIYYIDKLGNVYQAEDIVSNKVNPNIIAKYIKNGDNISIPEFGI